MSYDGFDKIIGRVLVAVEQHGKSHVVLVTTEGRLTLQAEGYCCSESWFESVDVDGIGGVITKIDTGTENQKPIEDKPEGVILSCFGTVYTTKGRTTWEMRNESNGYYSGYIVTSYAMDQSQ
jgi:hypothetical protein